MSCPNCELPVTEAEVMADYERLRDNFVCDCGGPMPLWIAHEKCYCGDPIRRAYFACPDTVELLHVVAGVTADFAKVMLGWSETKHRAPEPIDGRPLA